MNTYPIRNHDNRTFAFEIESVYIGVNKVVALLRSANNVADIHVRKLFNPVDDIHIEFNYMGTPFIVWEPYGDSSRYWIGPKDESHSQIDIRALENIFQQYQPFLLTKVIGDLISFKFLQIFRNNKKLK